MTEALTRTTNLAMQFAALHARGELFLLPNPWSGGSARLLEAAGFEALATTGAGAAFMHGKPDRRLGEAELLANIAQVCAATALPVTADMQDGLGESPEAAARAVRLAAEAGAVGCSIEDASSVTPGRMYAPSLAAERVQAAIEAAAGVGFPFIVTARCDNFFEGIADLDDTIARLQAYERAGAQALYAPGLRTAAQVRQVLQSVSRPLNVLMHTGAEFDLQILRSLGVRRVSVGAYFARVALDAMVNAAAALRDGGTLALHPKLTAAYLNQLFVDEPFDPPLG